MDRNSPGIKYCILCKKVCPTSEALDEHFRSHKSMKFGSNNTGNEVVHESKTQKDGASEGIYQYSENFTEALNKLHSLFSQLGEERLKNTKLLLVEVTDEDANTTIKNLEKLVGHNKIVDLTKEEIKVKHVPLTEKNVQPIKEYNIFQNVPMSTASGIPSNVDDVINKEVISPVINESFINASRTRTDKGIELDKSSNIGNAFSNESKSLQTPSTVETEMNFEFVRDDVKAGVSKSIIDKYSAKLRSIQWIKDTLLQNQVETPKDYKPFAEDLYDSDNDKKNDSVNKRNRSSSRPSTHNRHVSNVQQNERRNYKRSYEDRFDSPRQGSSFRQRYAKIQNPGFLDMRSLRCPNFRELYEITNTCKMCKKVCLFPREKIYHVLVDHMNLEDPLTLKCAICVRRGNSQKKFLDFESLRAHFLNSSGHPRPEDFINNLSCTYTGSTEHVFPTGYKQIFRTYEWHFTKCFIG